MAVHTLQNVKPASLETGRCNTEARANSAVHNSAYDASSRSANRRNNNNKVVSVKGKRVRNAKIYLLV